ncbi:hypothetical protein [Luteolibacter sp. LG18]|uniref:hypothetical protein n=1 Tax=Luteolibacter sp. LG18 TaxID=2819286 RepID=UPI0030C6AE22
MKTRWKWLGAGLMAWVLSSCGAPDYEGPANTAPNVVAARRTAAAASSQGLERQGLATTAGSIVTDVPERGGMSGHGGPYGVDSIYYNDRAGLTAMGVQETPINGFFPVAGGVLEWGLKDNASNFLTAYYRPGSNGGKGRHFVEGKAGEEYSVVLYNRCNCRLLVVLSIDGVNVKDGRMASANQDGFVVEAGSYREVKGYHVMDYYSKAFQFTSVANSKARYTTGDTRNVGVIGIAVFKPQGVDPWKWVKDEGPQNTTVF